MKNFSQLSAHESKRIKGILTDIDDTLTENGKLTQEGFEALWRAKNAGLHVVPITGRPAGWCDMIARFWPVTGVIGENGAFYFYLQDNKCKRFYVNSPETREQNKKKLMKIKEVVLKNHSGVNIASDQAYREADLAIDFREEVPDQGFDVANSIKKIFESFGAVAKISSIHVNGWFGSYDKLKTTKLFLKNVLALDPENEKENFIFFGDSPNDEPMFNYFPLSCGIGNIDKYDSLISKKPAFKSTNAGGKGVLEVINHILTLRSNERITK